MAVFVRQMDSMMWVGSSDLVSVFLTLTQPTGLGKVEPGHRDKDIYL